MRHWFAWGAAAALALLPTLASAQAALPTPGCVPAKLLPPSGSRMRTKDIGNSNPTVAAEYLDGLIALYCPPADFDNGWAKVARAALDGYRPAIRLLALQIPETLDLLFGREQRLYDLFIGEARMGSSSAANAAAHMLAEGLGVPRDLSGALNWYTFSARNRNERAMEHVAIMKALGLGGKVDPQGAQRLLFDLPPHRMVRAVARILVGLAAQDASAEIQDWNATFAPQLGEELAVRLQSEFSDELGRTEDADIKMRLKKHAALLGVAGAKVDYARSLLQAGDVAMVRAAISQLEDAAKADILEASRLLARIAVDPDYEHTISLEARAAVRRAASAGSGNAMLVEADLYYFAEYGAPSLQFAANSLRAASKKGVSVAQLRYGIALSLGLGTPEDPQRSRQWLRKAAEGGDQLAIALLVGLGETPPPTPAPAPQQSELEPPSPEELKMAD